MPNCKICGKPVAAVSVAHDSCRLAEAKRLAADVCAYRCKMAVICQDLDRLKKRHCASCALPKLIEL